MLIYNPDVPARTVRLEPCGPIGCSQCSARYAEDDARWLDETWEIELRELRVEAEESRRKGVYAAHLAANPV